MEDIQKLSSLYSLYETFKCVTKRKRRYGADPYFSRRNKDGEYRRIYYLITNIPRRFFSYTRMEPCVFDRLLDMIETRFNYILDLMDSL